MKKYAPGFSLIELMVVVVIIGILSAIAVPSYQNYVIRTNRSLAQAALVQLATVMEQYRIRNNNSYTGATLGAGGIFPNGVPLDATAANQLYTLSIDNPIPSDSYVLRATPIANTAAANDPTVASFILTSTGQKLYRTVGGQGGGTPGWDIP